MAEKKWKCRKCGSELAPSQVVFDYMNLSFSENLLCCPKCGQVMIPHDLAKGKMTEVEQMLEDK